MLRTAHEGWFALVKLWERLVQGPVKVHEVPRRGTISLTVGETYGPGVGRYSTPKGSNVCSQRLPRVSPAANDVRPLRGRDTAPTLTGP